MKLIFPGGEHQAVSVQAGDCRIGSGPDCEINLSANGIAPSHAALTMSPDGVAFLAVDDPDKITTLNGKQVVGQALVKVGDLLMFSGVRCRVVDELKAVEKQGVKKAEPVVDDGRTRVRMALPKYMLRGVSGNTFGKHFPLMGTSVIGRQHDCDIVLASEEISRHHARISVTPAGVRVEDLGSANGTYVNGKKVKDAELKGGDELRLDNLRFLFQAPGMPAAGANSDAPTTVRSSDPEGSNKGLFIGLAVGGALIAGIAAYVLLG